MEQAAPSQPKRARGFYTSRWKKAKDAFHRITAITTGQNKTLLGIEHTPDEGVTKSLIPLDELAQRGGKPDVWEQAVAGYEHAMTTYLSMLDKAEDIQPPAFIKKDAYLAAIQTLERELKALQMETKKDLAHARAQAAQEGSNQKRLAVIHAEFARGHAGVATARSRVARLKIDKTQVFAVWNGEVKEAALILTGMVNHINRTLAAQQVHGIAIPSSISQSLTHFGQSGVPHKDEVHDHPDVAKRVAELHELELTLGSLEEWLNNTEQVLQRH